MRDSYSDNCSCSLTRRVKRPQLGRSNDTHPLESNPWWSAINLHHFPSESRHHTLESLVTRRKVRVLRTIVLIWRDDCIVSPKLQKLLGRDSRTSIHRESVIFMVDGSPIFTVNLERSFDLPVLDEVLD